MLTGRKKCAYPFVKRGYETAGLETKMDVPPENNSFGIKLTFYTALIHTDKCFGI